WKFHLTAVPVASGFAVFDIPRVLPSTDCALVGLQWGRDGDDVWVVPLTHARNLGLKPSTSLCPLTPGFAIADGDSIDDVHDGEVASVKAMAIALWHRMTEATCQLINPSKGKPSSFLVVRNNK